jgi:hypothetical protein
MKRRKFIQNSALGAITLAISPALMALGKKQDASYRILQKLTLSEFPGEQDETPVLVTGKNSSAWLFSLRRLPYPAKEEVISVFSKQGKDWKELAPLTGEPGQFETIAAACAPNGMPAVAWSSKNGDEWDILISLWLEDGFTEAEKVGTGFGRAINPVLIAPDANRLWLAWESYEKGKFKICLRQFKNGIWGKIITGTGPNKSSYEPAIAEGPDGKLYLAYSVEDGPHRNIEMKIFDTQGGSFCGIIPVAIGGPFKNRVNINSGPALAFDHKDRLWISWENNRDFARRQDSDCYTGNRSCAVVCYTGGKLCELDAPGKGKWLFRNHNDQRPTFIKDTKGNLHLMTRSGSVFSDGRFWRFRISSLDPRHGWKEPVTLFETKQQGANERPALIFDGRRASWLAYRKEQFIDDPELPNQRILESRMELMQLEVPELDPDEASFSFVPAVVEELHISAGFEPVLSGRPPVPRRTKTYMGKTYTLLMGNLHEHTEMSPCWPAGTDGSSDQNYRYGKDAEGYDFMALTDHDHSINEVMWRRNLRMADFYNDGEYFVTVPAVEWTKNNGKNATSLKPGVGHVNIIFESNEEAWKYLRNKHGLYSGTIPETGSTDKLWSLLREKRIKAVTIPHHVADENLPFSWEEFDQEYTPVVEIYQCRGNGEHPGCPKNKPLTRHNPTRFREAYIDYALAEKRYKMGFIASGDHNSIGVGLAALWVEEVSRKGILEALRSRRCFATTGDKIFVDFIINGFMGGETLTAQSTPRISLHVESVKSIQSIEILKDSKVVKKIVPGGMRTNYTEELDAPDFHIGGSCYYYLRVIQNNNQIAWSSPVWIES